MSLGAPLPGSRHDAGPGADQTTGLRRLKPTGLRRKRPTADSQPTTPPAPATTPSAAETAAWSLKEEPFERIRREEPEEQVSIEPPGLSLDQPYKASVPRPPAPEPETMSVSINLSQFNWRRIGLGLLTAVVVIGAIVLLVNALKPIEKVATVVACNWDQSVTVSSPRVSTDNGWQETCTGEDCRIVPDTCVEKQDGMKTIQLDTTHKEDTGLTEDCNCQDVPDGTEWQNDPNGTCTWEDDPEDPTSQIQVCPQILVAKTKKSCETCPILKNVPDTAQVPNMRNWCSFERTTWWPTVFPSRGSDQPPVWPTYTAGARDRVNKNQTYEFVFRVVEKDKEARYNWPRNSAEFTECKISDRYDVTLQFNRVTKAIKLK